MRDCRTALKTVNMGREAVKQQALPANHVHYIKTF